MQRSNHSSNGISSGYISMCIACVEANVYSIYNYQCSQQLIALFAAYHVFIHIQIRSSSLYSASHPQQPYPQTHTQPYPQTTYPEPYPPTQQDFTVGQSAGAQPDPPQQNPVTYPTYPSQPPPPAYSNEKPPTTVQVCTLIICCSNKTIILNHLKQSICMVSYQQDLQFLEDSLLVKYLSLLTPCITISYFYKLLVFVYLHCSYCSIYSETSIIQHSLGKENCVRLMTMSHYLSRQKKFSWKTKECQIIKIFWIIGVLDQRGFTVM